VLLEKVNNFLVEIVDVSNYSFLSGTLVPWVGLIRSAIMIKVDSVKKPWFQCSP